MKSTVFSAHRNAIIFITLLLVSAALAACGKKETPTPTPAPPTATSTPIPPTATPTPDLAVPIVAPILPEARPTPIATPIPVPTIVVQSALVEAPDLTTNIFVEYILDASGSMMGQLADHTRKRDVAEKVLAQRIRSFPSQIHIGFRAFGHHMDWRGQEDKSCKDIELIAPVQTGQLEKIASWLEKNYNARGMTPLAQSVRDAVEDLPKEGEVNNAIVLISDGKETCGGDPCAVVRQLKERGIHFTLHVVGMNVQPEEAEQLLCVARAGQGYYIPVQTAREMNQALEKIEQHIAEGNEPVVAQLPTPTAVPTNTPSPTLTPTAAPVLESGNWIVYAKDHNIWVINPATLEVSQLTNFQSEEANGPVWSPDRTKIAFVVKLDPLNADLFVLDIKTGETTQLLPEKARTERDKYVVGLATLTWTPDGSMIYFSKTDDALGRYWQLRRIRSDGTGKIEIPPMSQGWFQEMSPSFSPDGKYMLFAGTQERPLIPQPPSNWGIYLSTPDGSLLTQFLIGNSSSTDWSPDGNFIMYDTPQTNEGIFLMTKNGDVVARLSDFGKNPVWSPQGDRIVFEYQLPDNYRVHEIWIMNSDGTNLKKLTLGMHPDW